MRERLCVLLVIALLGFSNASFAHSNDSNRKATETEFPKGARAICGRYIITLNSGEILKNVKACWTVDDDRVRIVQNGKVRMVAKAEIKEQEYSATRWEKFKDGARLVLLIPAMPVLLLMYCLDFPKGHWN